MGQGQTIFRNTGRLLAVLTLTVMVQACTGTKQVGVVADAMKGATLPMKTRVISLKQQHEGLVDSYNTLRKVTIARYGELHDYLCRTAAAETRVALYKGQADTLSFLQKKFDAASGKISDEIDNGLAGLISEIDRQKALKKQQAQSGSSALLPGQYTDMVLISLLASRDALRLQGIKNMEEALQTKAREVRTLLDNYVKDQLDGISKAETACKADTTFKDAAAAKLGDPAASAKDQYKLAETYLNDIADTSAALKLYAQTNSLFGKKGLLAMLAGGALSRFTTAPGDAQPAAAENAKSTKLSTVIANAASVPLLALANGSSGFSLSGILSSLGLTDAADVLNTILDAQKKNLTGEVSKTIDGAKTDADSSLTSAGRS